MSNKSNLPNFTFRKKLSFSLPKLWEFLKTNLTILILVPTIIGGCYQLWFLADMQLTFVRFFSVSQVVSDGLMVIIALLGFFLCFLYIFLFSHLIPQIKKEDSKFKSFFKFSIYIFTIILLLFINSTNFDYSNPISIFINLFSKLNLILIFLYLIYSLGFIFFTILKKDEQFYCYDDYMNFLYLENQRIFNIILYLISILILIIMSSSINYLLKTLNNYSNIENFNILKQQLIENSLPIIDPKIVYYNKDYIFIDLNLLKNCRCDINIICSRDRIINNYSWNESKYRVLEGKVVIELYK